VLLLAVLSSILRNIFIETEGVQLNEHLPVDQNHIMVNVQDPLHCSVDPAFDDLEAGTALDVPNAHFLPFVHCDVIRRPPDKLGVNDGPLMTFELADEGLTYERLWAPNIGEDFVTY
jgi:hypothetical protein